MQKLLFLFLGSVGVLKTRKTESIQLLHVFDNSDLSLIDLWTYKNAPATYRRNSLIDDWDISPPTMVQLIVKDASKRNLFSMNFDSNGASSNLSSWLNYTRYEGGFRIASPFETYVGTDILEMRNPVDNDSVFLAHGKYNGSLYPQLICFTTNGSPFSLTSAIEGRELKNSIFFERNYHNDTGFYKYYVSDKDLKTEPQYIRSIAVLNENNTNITFSLEYAPWSSFCINRELQDIKYKYSFISDGNLNTMDVFKARCLRISFSELVYNITIYLAQPVDDYLLGVSILIVGTYDEEPQGTTTSSSTITTNTDTTDDTTTQSLTITTNTNTSDGTTTQSSTITTNTDTSDGTTSQSSTITTNIDTTEETTIPPSTKTTNTDYTGDIITLPSITTTNSYDSCDCKCPVVTNEYEHLTNQNLTYKQLEEALRNETEQLKKKLSVDKKSLSSTTRTKISAIDKRRSSSVIGLIGGLFIGLEALFIISHDLCWCYNQLKIFIKKLFKKHR